MIISLLNWLRQLRGSPGATVPAVKPGRYSVVEAITLSPDGGSTRAHTRFFSGDRPNWVNLPRNDKRRLPGKWLEWQFGQGLPPLKLLLLLELSSVVCHY